jgi:tetratricopeptide (TPR) repeat protein
MLTGTNRIVTAKSWYWIIAITLIVCAGCKAQTIDISEKHYERGLELLDKGDLQGALKEFQTTTKLNPNGAPAFYEIAKIYEELGNLEEAKKAYEQSIKVDDQFAGIHHGYGHLLDRLGEHQLALQEHQKSVELDPNNAVFWLSFGHSKSRNGKLEDALRCFAQAYELDPNNDAVVSSFGQAFAKLGKDEKAVPLLKRAIEMDAKDEYSRKLLNNIETKRSKNRDPAIQGDILDTEEGLKTWKELLTNLIQMKTLSPLEQERLQFRDIIKEELSVMVPPKPENVNMIKEEIKRITRDDPDPKRRVVTEEFIKHMEELSHAFWGR